MLVKTLINYVGGDIAILDFGKGDIDDIKELYSGGRTNVPNEFLNRKVRCFMTWTNDRIGIELEK